MTIKLTATDCTINGKKADWTADRANFAAMLKAKLNIQ